MAYISLSQFNITYSSFYRRVSRIFRLTLHLFLSVILLLITLPSVASAQEPRPWDLSIRLFSTFDDNVALKPRSSTFTGKEESISSGIYLSGSYRIIQNKKWQVGVTTSIIQTANTEANLNDFNLSSVMPSLFSSYSFDAWGKPASLGMAYAFRRDWLGGVGFETSHTLKWDVGMRPIPSIQTGVYYNFAINDFSKEGTVPGLTSRDATKHLVGIKGTYSFDRNRRSFMLNYEFARNNAEGDNFVFNSNRILGRFTTLLIPPSGWFWRQVTPIRTTRGLLPGPGEHRTTRITGRHCCCP